MPKIKDTDYLFLSTRIKSMERNLLNGERLERMLEARTPEDAAKVLTECGWPDMPRVNLDELDRVLTLERDKTLKDLTSSAPHPEILEVFKVKYDYHNIKTLLKAEAMGTDAERLLVSAGRVKVEELTEKLRSGDLRGLPGILQAAAGEAREVLGTTGDPQLADFVLDRACYADMADIANKSGSAFLAGYVRITVDAANLRSVVRTLRMGKGAEFLKGVLFRGGNVDTGRILSAVSSGGSIEEIYTASALREAAAAGAAAITGGRLTHFEKLCDDAVTDYLAGARYVAFGEAPLIGYLTARETELTNVRVILSGRLAGLDADTIRERLRESYV